MPWKVTCVMDMRRELVEEWLSGTWSVAELGRCYGISRKTVYKWLERYAEEGEAGLADRSRAPLHQPNAVAPAVENAILAARRKHPTWGPRKLRRRLERVGAPGALPATSTIGEILRRHGLVERRRTRSHATPSASPLGHCQAVNQVWCADFKGWFRTGDGERCDPLTIMDAHSRYLIRCQAMTPATDGEAARGVFEAAFREFGLPAAIRTDNGPPFASTGLGGLSRLSVWWLRLGIRLERIRPAKPQDNGRHERMHRTLKAETAAPPRHSLRAQQRAFDAFRREYNEERPHEAIALETPGSLYHPSPRPYPERLPAAPSYPDDWPIRRVRGCGQMKWGGRDVQVTAALVGEAVGLEPVEKGVWNVFFGPLWLGVFDERKGQVRRPKKEDKSEFIALPTVQLTTKRAEPVD